MVAGACCFVYGFALKIYSPSCSGVAIGFLLLWYVVSCASPCPCPSLRQGVIPQSDGQASPTRAPGSPWVLQRGQDGLDTARLITGSECREQIERLGQELLSASGIPCSLAQGSLGHPGFGHFIPRSQLPQDM